MKKVIVGSIAAVLLVGCGTGSQPALNANSNKIEVMSLSRFINVTNVTYSGSLNNNTGGVTKLRD